MEKIRNVTLSVLFLASIYMWYYIPELITIYVPPSPEFKSFYNAVCLTDFIKIAFWAFIAGYLIPWEQYKLKILFYNAFFLEAHSAISFLFEKYYFDTFLSTNAKIASFVTLIPLSIYMMYRLYIQNNIVTFDKNSPEDRGKTVLAVRPPLNHWALIPFFLFGYGHISVIQDGYMYCMKKVDGGVIPTKHSLDSPLADEYLDRYYFIKTKYEYNFDNLMDKEVSPITKYNCFKFVKDARVKK